MTYYNMKKYKSHLFYIKLSKLFVKPDLSFHLKSSRKFISRKFKQALSLIYTFTPRTNNNYKHE